MSSDTYRVTIVKYGERSTHKSDVYLNHHIYGQDDDPIGMDYFIWVVQNADRTIIVDTGFSKHGGEVRNRTFGIDPARAYAVLGVEPEGAPDVVVTHAHYDHIGNLGLFPKSTLVIAQREFDFWTGPLGTRKQFHHSVEDEEIAALVVAKKEGRVRAYEGSLDLAPGVTLLELGGHTPGLTVVLVATDEGTVLAFDAGTLNGFVERTGGRLSAVSGVCTHLGCRLRLNATATELDCPCHNAALE